MVAQAEQEEMEATEVLVSIQVTAETAEPEVLGCLEEEGEMVAMVALPWPLSVEVKHFFRFFPDFILLDLNATVV